MPTCQEAEQLNWLQPRQINPYEFKFTPPLLQCRDCEFSFSGLKGAMYYLLRDLEKKYNLKENQVLPCIYNLSAGFLLSVTRHICNRTLRAMTFIEWSDCLLVKAL